MEIASPRSQTAAKQQKRTQFKILICKQAAETHSSSNFPNKNLTECPRQLLHPSAVEEKHT